MIRLHLSAAVLAVICTTAQAHRVWVASEHTHGGQILKAKLGYGEFPDFEPISPDRVSIFNRPMQLHTAGGSEDLVQQGQNYEYRSRKPVAEGSYVISAQYRPTFWSKNKAGWRQADMRQMPDAEYCEQTRMYGKNIVNVGHRSADMQTISQPLGHLLEIVPLDNPANVRVGGLFKVQVLYRGEPLAGAVLTATFEGFDMSDRSKTHKVEAQAFSDITGADGTVEIIPLRQGFWKASVEHKADFADSQVCGKEATYATLTFDIGHDHH
ncbi:DUF4198 domain-containing protein [Neisseria leonii]|uniref:DUF4198 domain-containing protein n=1 Tax=Neisseria leonii TaxID=2995413 RepID=A0A9X4IDL2_9NEIS|nr:DUF4198 domain-containing protein [Neisseria sp. 51.81]MDD9327327.1 DUF4198 domain-containing protein [Neisseria sp. 51.81]